MQSLVARLCSTQWVNIPIACMRVCVCVCVCVCIIRERRLRWLGHVARMENTRLPKCLLFGELPATRPRHGPKRRWRDVIMDDFGKISPQQSASSWYDAAQVRPEWRMISRRRPPSVLSPTPVHTCSCGRTFRRPGDLKRHSPYCKAWRWSIRYHCRLTMGMFKVQGSRCVCVCVCVRVCVRVCVCQLAWLLS